MLLGSITGDLPFANPFIQWRRGHILTFLLISTPWSYSGFISHGVTGGLLNKILEEGLLLSFKKLLEHRIHGTDFPPKTSNM